ncbi:probable ATP-dependent RNA helicase DDX28 [Gigantopelta aegis]|uniref:probable ATP-dependent RNA helicase DDX28 n=1 Tax=Gigantopelta aegis TaxID=1735272 RepID=UPI001B88A689|nr:probable ATP-dependent RNA helicase DDX28 [Gigantopelta aegis]XP_041353806.1 probable ATP-dependent RNA helicase DDX28 [Gigantopelta aegis]
MASLLCVCRSVLVVCRRQAMTLADQANLTKITVPQKMVAKIEKLKYKKMVEAAKKKKPLKFKSPLVISCKRTEYNHHRGQTYNEFDPQVLASHGWKHRKSAGDHFTVMCRERNPALLTEETELSFANFSLNDRLQNGLHQLGFHTPTNIQSLAIPKILKGGDVLCAAETGSGKTLAYLLPLVEIIYQQNQLMTKEISKNSPKAIILVPSRELADQIMDVAEKLAPYSGIITHTAVGGRGTKQRLAWYEWKPMDVLISTPGILKKLLSNNKIHRSYLQHIVLDEADTLLDDSFSDDVKNILRKLQLSKGGGGTDSQLGVVMDTQFILVGATMPRSIEQVIGEIIPAESLQKVTTSHLHYIMPHVPQKFLRLLPSQKAEMIIKLASDSHKKGVPTMIFCNKSNTCFWLSETLREMGVNNVLMNGVMQEQKRHAEYESFKSGHTDILVATDIASRGLDTINVQHVINFDFPLFMSDYIHRAGRVGRVSSRTNGLVSNFVTHLWDVDLLWNIETAVRKNTELHNVNANIKRKLTSIIINKYGHRYNGQ